MTTGSDREHQDQYSHEFHHVYNHAQTQPHRRSLRGRDRDRDKDMSMNQGGDGAHQHQHPGGSGSGREDVYMTSTSGRDVFSQKEDFLAAAVMGMPRTPIKTGWTTRTRIGDSSYSPSSPAPRRKTSDAEDAPDKDSIIAGMRPAIIFAQAFNLLPVYKPLDIHQATFKKKSLRTALTVLLMLGMLFMSVMAFAQMVLAGVKFYTSVNAIFFTTSLMAVALFLRMSATWREMMAAWVQVETCTMQHYGYPPRLGFRMASLTAIQLILALIEHLLSLCSTLAYVWPCYTMDGFPRLVKGYFLVKYPRIFTVTRYNIFKGLGIIFLQFSSVFVWNYIDLFIMLISMGLAARFSQLNQALESVKGQAQPMDFWRAKRETFNALSNLAKRVDDWLGPIIIVSYASNLYFICLQLLTSMNPVRTTVFHDAYFNFSLVYLVLRTTFMTYLAANVYDESKRAKDVLYCVPSTSYCKEVQRFLSQVVTDNIALTGCNFFSLTRSFMLTVAGTIVTYVVVLVQFHDNAGENPELQVSLSNRTIPCTCEGFRIPDC